MRNEDYEGQANRAVPPDAPGAVFHPTPGATPLPSLHAWTERNDATLFSQLRGDNVVEAPQTEKQSPPQTNLPTPNVHPNSISCSNASHIPPDGVLVQSIGTGKPPRFMVYDVKGRRLHAHHLRPARRQEKLTKMLKDLFRRHDESDERNETNGAKKGPVASLESAAHSIHTHGHQSSSDSGRSSRIGSPTAQTKGAEGSTGQFIRTYSEKMDMDAADAVLIANQGDKPPSLLSSLAQKLRTQETNPEEVLTELLSQRSLSDSSSLSDRYGHLSSVVGRGSFGVVRLAHKADPENKNRKLVYAVKEFHPNAQESEAKYLKRLASEFCLASSLHHVNIIQTLDLLKGSHSNYCNVMEYCAGGDLYSLIVVAGRLEPAEADCFFKQIMRGVAYMHEMGVAHRDLKPENVLLTSRGCCKLTDFGNAECFRMAWEHDIHMSSALAGSGPYIAPEEYKKQSFDPRAVDVWAAGVLYMAMCTGRHLWHEARPNDEFFTKYLNGRKDEHGYEPIERLKTSKRRNVIYSILDPVASRRLTAKQMLNSEWGREIVICEAGEGEGCHREAS